MRLPVLNSRGYLQKSAFAVILSAVLMTIGTAMPQASASVAKVDFNGDGYADLAIGVPNEGVNGRAEAGLVNVIYGSASGLSATATPDQRFFQDYAAPSGPFPNIRDTSEAGDHFAAAIAAGDFNKDGYSDLAIGVPGEDLGSIADAGAINVIYGSASGLSPDSAIVNQFWTQDSPNVEDSAEAGERFGSALATGDFNKDGYADLAIGVPGEGINGHPGAGSVNILYGSASGLSAMSTPDQRFFQDSPGVADFSENNDHYGASLAVGDLNKDGYGDLMIGVPGEDIGSVADAGAISVIYGSAAGLSPSGPVPNQLWTGSSPGISDDLPAACPTPISGIGNPGALASGDFNGDGYSDMAFGAATHFAGEGGTPVCGHSFYGSDGIAIVIYGSASGLAITPTRDDQVGRENSIADYARTISAGDFNKDGYSDLVTSFAVYGIVAPGDLTGGGFGSVKIYHGSASGLPENSDGLLQASQGWSQDSPNVEDDGETQDNFGAAVSTGDFNNDGYLDMAVGVPREEAGVSGPGSINNDNTGAVNVIYGSAAGLSATAIPDQFWTQDSPNIEDAAEIGDMFGTALA